MSVLNAQQTEEETGNVDNNFTHSTVQTGSGGIQNKSPGQNKPAERMRSP